MPNNRAGGIGIIGGAGPMAGILLCRKVVEICQEAYGCVNDEDFPRILLLSVPFSQMLEQEISAKGYSIVSAELSQALDFLQKSGVEYFAIACNTLHAFIDREQMQQGFVDIVEEAKRSVDERTSDPVLVLCTSTARRQGVYSSSPSTLFPTQEQQIRVDEIIKNLLRGCYKDEDRRFIETLYLSTFQGEPGGKLLLGCTELSLLHNKLPLSLAAVAVIDPLAVAAEKLCRLCMG